MTDLTGAEAAREAVLKAEALECLSGMLAALGGWVDDQLGTGAAAEAKKAAKLAEAVEAAARAADDGESVAPPAVVSEVSGIEKKKASKLEYQEAVALFNKKAKKGIALMQKIGRLGTSPAEIAEFLRATPGSGQVRHRRLPRRARGAQPDGDACIRRRDGLLRADPGRGDRKNFWRVSDFRGNRRRSIG